MAKTRSNKRPRTANATVVDNKANTNTTTTSPTTTTSTPPTNVLSAVVTTRTRSRKSKDGLSDDKANTAINSKKSSKINLTTIENTHNTRRRSLNKNIKNAAGDMDTSSNMDSSPETGTDSNGTHSPESLSDNEHEVIKVIEIVDEAESYNLPDDDEDEEGKEYELMYVEDAEEGEGEIEYLNEEYLLDDDFIIQEEQQNDDNSQSSMAIEEVVDDFTIESMSLDTVAETEQVSEQPEIIRETIKLPPIVPMATRSRRGHVSVLDTYSEKTKLSRRKMIVEPTTSAIEDHEVNKEAVVTLTEPPPSILESTKTEEISKPKVFIPNIEPPATRARCRKSLSTSDPIGPSAIIKGENLVKTPLEEINILKSDVFQNSPEISTTQQSHIETLHGNSLSESKSENTEVLPKKRGRRRTRFLNSPNGPETNSSVLIGNKEITKSSNNQDQSKLTQLELDEPKNELAKDIIQKSVTPNELMVNKDIMENAQKKVMETIINEKPKSFTPPTTPKTEVQPALARSIRHSKLKISKSDIELHVEKLNTNKQETTMDNKEAFIESNEEPEKISNDKKKEENEPPPEIDVKSNYSPKPENSSVLVVHQGFKTGKENETVVEVSKANKKQSNDDINIIAEISSIQTSVPEYVQNIENMEVDIEKNSCEVDASSKVSPGLRKLRRRSRKECTPPPLTQIKLNESDISQPIAINQSVPDVVIPEVVQTATVYPNTEVAKPSIHSPKQELPSACSISDTPEKNEEKEERKSSLDEKTCSKTSSSRSQLAYTSIISTRRQKKEQIKTESFKSLENISDNCMAMVEKLLKESSINKSNTKDSSSPVTEAVQTKMESPKLETINKLDESSKKIEKSPKAVVESHKNENESPKSVSHLPKTVADSSKVTESPKTIIDSPKKKVDSPKKMVDPKKRILDSPKKPIFTQLPKEQEKFVEVEKMEVDQVNTSTEVKPSATEIEFKEPIIGHALAEKLKNIKLDQTKTQLKSEESLVKYTNPAIDPNSTKIKEFETKINRNFYAEAFAGLSHETRTHIFEALLRSKSDNKPNKDTAEDESIELDDKQNIFTKKKSNKKIKKSSKKERSKSDKSETSNDDSKLDDDESLRRSSRIKTISQTRQRSQHGHGLVKPRGYFHDLDDELDIENSTRVKYKALELDGVEPKDYLTTEETETEVQREREMIHRLKQFMTIKENIYHCDKNISKEAKKMTCDCFLTKEEIERGELGCGEDCLNRLLMIECGPKCVVAERCTNRKFQKTQYSNCKVFQTEKKGFGIMAGIIIPPGEFIMEYVGEVLNSEQFEKRADDYSKDKNKHYYFMALRSDAVIDATAKGNISRFINHSCDPNAETQKWTVNGELRIGFFSTRVILKGEEITFDYQFQRYGKEAQKCFCEASNCRGWIGEEPDSGEEDDDEEEEEEEEEEPQPLPQTVSEKTDSIPPILPPPVAGVKEILVSEKMPTPVVEPIDEALIIVTKEISMEVPEPVPGITELAEIAPIVAVAKPKKPTKKERKALVKTRKTRSELLEDADLEEEINILNRTGLKNQQHTLKFSRLMVRAKLMNARIRLLQLLQNGEMPCRRLFLDYHGLRLLHGWMSDSTTVPQSLDILKFQLKLLDTLKSLPIPNKTMLKDSKVMNLVQKWSLDDKKNSNYSPNDDTPSDSGSATPIQQNDSPNTSQTSTPVTPHTSISGTVDDELSYVSKNIIKISLKLIENWSSLPEVFRIPKKERIEQMKEHEREADLRYKALGLSEDKTENFYGKKWDREKQHNKKLSYNNNNSTNNNNNSSNKPTNTSTPQLDKYQRRQIFEMKFAKEQEEKKKQEYWRLHEMTCTCFRLDPRKTPQDEVPAIVNPATGQWYTKEMKPVATPPSHSHIKPPEQVLSTNPDDYVLPKIDLPPHWKFAIDTKGRIYYYHVKIRIPQWEPPIFLPPLAVAEETKPIVDKKEKDVVLVGAEKESSSTDTTDSSEDELKERINNLKQRFKERGQPLPEINITDSELVESLDADAKNKDNFSDTFPRIDPVKSSYKINKRKRRREGLVQERIISPRTEEDKQYGQQQSRMYRETKEKLRRRKEEMRKRRLLESGSLSMRNNKIIKLTDGLPVSISPYDSDESDEESEQTTFRRSNDSLSQHDPDSAVDFVESLISHNMSANDARLLDGLKEIGKEKVNKKNVYEEWKKQQAKLKSDARKRELIQSRSHHQSTSGSSSSSSSHVKRRKVALVDNIDLSSDEIRRIKEKFRTDIAGVIVQHLGPYRKESCKIGKILHDEDFKHLARKLTHFVMLKELKHCDNTVNILEVTDSVKIKSREFIKKYMAKYGAVYRRGENEPEYKD